MQKGEKANWTAKRDMEHMSEGGQSRLGEKVALTLVLVLGLVLAFKRCLLCFSVLVRITYCELKLTLHDYVLCGVVSTVGEDLAHSLNKPMLHGGSQSWFTVETQFPRGSCRSPYSPTEEKSYQGRCAE